MEKKQWNNFLFAILVVSSLVSYQAHCTSAAYMPVVLRECLANVYELEGTAKNSDFEQLYRMIKENRVLASEKMVESAVLQALTALKNNDRFDAQWKKEAVACLEKYIDTLDTRSILCSLKGDNGSLERIPHALLARSLQADVASRDMMYLASQLTDIQNIELCGNVDFSHLPALHAKSIKPTLPTDPSIMFNANTLTSMNSSNPAAVSIPNVVFGTGVTSPVINAWMMPMSELVQTPVNIQFSVPSDLREKQAISLELHFLVTKQGFANGNISIRIKSLFADNVTQFSMPESMIFNDIIDSSDLFIVEPALSNGLLHAYIDVPLQNSSLKKRDFAFMSLSRVDALGVEYEGNVYLVSAAFKYTRQQ